MSSSTMLYGSKEEPLLFKLEKIAIENSGLKISGRVFKKIFENNNFKKKKNTSARYSSSPVLSVTKNKRLPFFFLDFGSLNYRIYPLNNNC